MDRNPIPCRTSRRRGNRLRLGRGEMKEDLLCHKGSRWNDDVASPQWRSRRSVWFTPGTSDSEGPDPCWADESGSSLSARPRREPRPLKVMYVRVEVSSMATVSASLPYLPGLESPSTYLNISHTVRSWLL